MRQYLDGYRPGRTPQTKKADQAQSRNNAGGYAFTLDALSRARRWLILGSGSGTYYATPRALTLASADAIVSLARRDHAELVNLIRDVSLAGAAPRQDPGLFALAVAASAGTDEEKRHALAVLPDVARTGSTLLSFAAYLDGLRPFGRAVRAGLTAWYTRQDPADLAYQLVKYRRRAGMTHQRIFRRCRPALGDSPIRPVIDWLIDGAVGESAPRLIEGYVRAQEPGADVPALVRDYKLTWEMLPSGALRDPDVWDALLDAGMPAGALLRQLGRLTQLGLLPQIGGRTSEVCAALTHPGRLRRARIHPLGVLLAMRSYQSGASRGGLTWTPSAKVLDALDEMFYLAFEQAPSSGARTMLAIDASASMTQAIAGTDLSAMEAAAAMALVTAATEPEHVITAFTRSGNSWGAGNSSLAVLGVSPRQRLTDAYQALREHPWGGTDCALPMIHAREQGLAVDHFVVYTDNETWAGRMHPHQALAEYRAATGIPARLTVVGMTATEFTIADPGDAGMLDVVGFDAAAPGLISAHGRGAVTRR